MENIVPSDESLADVMRGSSWGLTYNMFADKLLKTNVFPESVFDMRMIYRQCPLFFSIDRVFTETAWYKTVFNGFGVPLDTRRDSFLAHSTHF